MAEGIALVAVIASVAIVVGAGFGIVLASRIGRLLDRFEREDEDTVDRAD